MDWRVKCLVPLVATTVIVGAHAAARARSLPKATQEPPSWVDPSTGLMWTPQGGEITWRNAFAYCQDLKYARLTGWRLPSLEQLQDIHDRKLTGAAFTGAVWSSARGIGDRGLPNTESWYFSFSDGTRATDGIDATPGKHVLCVRLSPEAIARARSASPYWVDPSTALMWTGQDNGKDVTWNDATKYCQGLRVGGSSDWRLPTIDELGGIYDRTASALGFGGGKRHDEPLDFRVKGNLFLTGQRTWSSSRVVDYRGKLQDAWLFDFLNGRRSESGDEADNGLKHSNNNRALCVRRSGP